MKFLILLALVALAYAEPESNAESNPDSYYYGYYGRPSHYGGYYGGYGNRYYGGYGGYGYGGYGYGNRFWKRSADSDSESNAESDPYLYYRNHYTNPYYSSYYGQHYYGQQFYQPHVYATHATVATPAVTYTKPAVATVAHTVAATPAVTYAAANHFVSPYAYAYAPRYVAQSAPGVVHTVAKREAESDSDSYYGYGGFYGHPGYGYGSRYGNRYYGWGGYGGNYYGRRNSWYY